MGKFEQPNKGLGEIFNDPDKKNLGKTREVYKVTGTEGVDFIVKDKRSDEELQALKFLSETGVSEKLLMYDQGKMIFEKVDGDHGSDYVNDLIKNNPDKITETGSPSTQGNSKFKIDSWTKDYLPENAFLADEKIRKYYVDYVSKLLFLVLSGILHNDIKTDNIFADKEGNVRFIDFGEASIVDDTKEMESMISMATIDIFKGLELMQVLNPVYGEISQRIKENERIKNILKDLYTQYQQEKIDLNSRQAILKKLSENGILAELISELGLPKELLADIENKLLSI